MILAPALVRSALRMLVESRPGFEVVSEAGAFAEALGMVVREEPDVVVVDLDGYGGGGLEFLRRLVAAAADARVLALTGTHDEEIHRRAIRLGAMGVVLKDKSAGDFLMAIEKVHAGEAWLNRSMMANLLEEARGTIRAQASEATRLASLSERELEVVRLVCEGLKNEEIARRLFRSEATVRHRLTSIFTKLGLPSRTSLIVYAHRNGIGRSWRN